MPHGGEDLVAAVFEAAVLLAEALGPMARRRTASPFSNVTMLETAHWLMMAVRREDIQEGYKLKLKPSGSHEHETFTCGLSLQKPAHRPLGNLGSWIQAPNEISTGITKERMDVFG